MDLTISDLTPEGKRVMDALAQLAEMEVAVGFQAGQTTEEKSAADVVDVAAYNELGTSTIPSRPFMRQSFENHEDALQAACDHAIKSIVNGSTVEQALTKLGVTLKGLVQKEIVDGGFKPNAPATIKRKKSAQPLIDTGTMRQSVNFIVRHRSED